MKHTYIYILSDPETQEIRYVGKTNNIKSRYKAHLNKRHNIKSHKRNWIDSLLKKNLKPILEVIDVVPINEWIFWEQYWISQIKTWGFNLVNHTNGGDGLTHSNKTSFKKGNVSWNTGTRFTKICEICGNKYKSRPSSKSRFCSKTCRAVDQRENLNKGNFKKGNIPWNKGKTYKSGGKKKSIPVVQIDKNTEISIKEFLGCKEAAKSIGCIPESIRLACIGKLKTVKGYKWKYKC